MTDERNREERLQNTLVMEELVSANQESSKTMLALVESVRRETSAQDRKIGAMVQQQMQLRWAIGLVVVGIAILICVAVINAANISNTRKQQQNLARVAAEVERTNAFLLDCVNSKGECGKANAVQQRKILDEVKRYELTGFYCIRMNPANADPEGEAFLKCMHELYPGGPTLERP